VEGGDEAISRGSKEEREEVEAATTARIHYQAIAFTAGVNAVTCRGREEKGKM
jgi:hypothetical protein